MRTDDQLEELWNYLNEHRGHESSSTLVDRWLHEGTEVPERQNLTPQLLYALSMQRGMWQDGQFLTPQPLAMFIARLAKLYSVSSVLDPTCGAGLLLHAVATSVQADVVHGIDINPRFAQIARVVLGDGANIIQADALSPDESIMEGYDLVVADPPLGMKLNKTQQVSGLGDTFSGEWGHALTVWACQHVNNGGAALIIVTPAFLWSPQAVKVHQAIVESGGCIRALVHLPSGSLNSTGIQSYLVVLERGKQKDIFVGQYSDDANHQEQLISNFKRRKPGLLPALGRFCPLAGFNGFEMLAASERLSRLVKTVKWEGVAAKEVFTAHSILGNQQVDPLERGPNSCYLRLTGKPLAALDPTDFSRTGSRSQPNLLHLHVAPEYADARFMVHWFNTSQVGKATLATLNHGSSVPSISLPRLLSTKLYLPPLAEQMRTIEGAAHLTRIRSVTDELEAALWDGTNDVDDIVESIATINQEDGFVDWIETLPFPLASILWRYHAGRSSDRERYETLLHFFEATAAFLATVHLSAFMASDSLWEEHGKRLSISLTRANLSLDRATFGSWKLVNEYLSSISATLLRDAKNAELWQRVYGTSSEKVLEMLGDAELRSVLQQSNRIRNDWSGHTGAISEDKAGQIHNELSQLVYVLRGVFRRTWLGYELVQPGDSRYSRGVHHYNAKRLMGTRSSPFEEVRLESVQPLESDALYLFDRMNHTGLQLRPFVLVIPSPERRTNACFIFNRREAGRGYARFVSYHFEEESEITDTFPGVDEALGRMHLFDKESSA